MSDIVDVKVGKTEKSSTSKKQAPQKKRPSTQVLALVALLVISVGAAVFFWNEAREANNTSDDAVAARNQQESEEVISGLTEILLTESEDEPTVARVEDPQLLKDANPDFYKNVDVGDHLVLYPQRAIIYRQSENRIINIAPIIDTSQLETEAGTSDSNGN